MKVWKIVGVIILVLLIAKMFGLGDNDWQKSDITSTITVSGQGEIVVVPDIATVSFGVTAENMNVATAQTESTTKMNAIIDFLKTKDVDVKDIKTTNYNIYPRYDYIQSGLMYGGRQTLAAYVVSQNVEVKIRDISRAGEILSGVGSMGVTNVSGLSFSLDKIEDKQDEAKALAIKDAKAQAKVLAEALGVKLVRITNFSENGYQPVYYGMEKGVALGMGGDMAVTAQLPAGENKVLSNVTITYEIK